MDKPLFIMMTLYSAIGILFILSASSISSVLNYGYSPYHYCFRQLLFVSVSFIFGFVIILKFPTKNYKKLVYLGLFGILFALVYILIRGELTNNVKSWFDLGPIAIQPSEFAKTVLIIYFGVFFQDYINKPNKKYAFLIPILFSIAIFLLVAMQPDLGTAVIIGGIAFFIFLSLPLDKNKNAQILKYISIAVLIVGATLVLTGTAPLTDEQMSRLEYKEPCNRYEMKTGYQVCNGFIAISNGGLFGKGIGNSTQKYLYLPEAHTDMIFPIVVEEVGVLFGILLIIGYMYILYRILKISKSCYNIRNSIICYGIMIYILMHLLVNFFGILALVPLTGVPVPFLSHGGSFSMNLICALFIVQRIAIENKNTKRELEIKSI